jgi:DAACS family dicarboxylate/amino acid:cation (Na+ or H+) symporter
MTLEKPHLLEEATASSAGGVLGLYRAIPLYLRIMVAFAVAIVLGLILGPSAEPLKWVSDIILRLLGALAPALILVAVMDSILNTNIRGSSVPRLIFLLLLNTTVAIVIGLVVVNLIQPGRHGAIDNDAAKKAMEKEPDAAEIGQQLLNNIPRSMVEPLVTNNVIGVVFLAIAFGIAFRKISKEHDISTVNQFISLLFKAIIVILHWVIDLVPLAVLCTVAQIIGTQGFKPLLSLVWFILAVLVALGLQATWYLVRIHFGCWAKPMDVLRGMRDALVMAFSTASSTATMPVTYACLRDKVGLREESASMGALVGANFNNDGTALYEAMAALFVGQMMNMQLSIGDQFVVMLMAVVASVGAAGIPRAGFVTMTLVFNAVDLPLEGMLVLLPVDWLLDRCRTAINVLGDVNVSCMLEGKTKGDETPAPTPPQSIETNQTPDNRPPDNT